MCSRRTLAVLGLGLCGLGLQGCGSGGPRTTPRPGSLLLDDYDGGDVPECPEDMRQKLVATVERYARDTGVVVSAAYIGPRSEDVTMGVSSCAMGYTSASARSSCQGDCLRRGMPMGSLTKLWTATAVLKLKEQGLLELDAPAFPYLDRAYRRATNRSLVKLLGDDIRNVTVRQMLGMRASLFDYDELGYQRAHPHEDMGPAELMTKYGHMSSHPVDTCGNYSSMSYTMLGLLLAEQSNGSAWDRYDQNVWRQLYPHVHFGVHGPCSSYTDIRGSVGKPHVDPFTMSCSGGYAAGNLVATTVTMARFVKDLFEGRVLQQESVDEMLAYQPLGGPGCGKVWRPGSPYGLGVEADPLCFGSGKNEKRFPGHSGTTYGYGSTTAYDTASGASISVALSSSGPTKAGAVYSEKLHFWKDLHRELVPNFPFGPTPPAPHPSPNPPDAQIDEAIDRNQHGGDDRANSPTDTLV